MREEELTSGETVFAGAMLVVLLVAIGSIFFGLLDTWSARDSSISFQEPKSGCEYKSYVGRYNPFYRATCELFRDRTLTEE